MQTLTSAVNILKKEFQDDEVKQMIISRYYPAAIEMTEKYTSSVDEQMQIIQIGFRKFFLFENVYIGNATFDQVKTVRFLEKMILYGAVSYFRHSLKQLTFLRLNKNLRSIATREYCIQSECPENGSVAPERWLPESARLVFYLVYEKVLTVKEVAHCLEISQDKSEALLKRLHQLLHDKERPVS